MISMLTSPSSASRCLWIGLLLVPLVLAIAAPGARAERVYGEDPKVGIIEHLGEMVPLDLVFNDEEGNPIKGIDRHPIVEDEVIIYSEATILGRVTIGRGSVIGGNVWLTHGVPPNSVITQAQVQHGLFESGGGI